MEEIEILKNIVNDLESIKAGDVKDFLIKHKLALSVKSLQEVRDILIKKLGIMEYEDGEWG